MPASPSHPVMQSVEVEVDALVRRAGSQEAVAAIAGCDQAQISRKATRVAAGDASWLEVLRAGQLLALAQADERLRAAVIASIERRRLPAGDERALPGDIQREVERSAALTQTWLRAMGDGVLTAAEVTEIIVAAEGLRETCDHVIRDARALQFRKPA